MIHFFHQKSFGVLTKNVHLIGHSLGAQISGYAGQRIKNLGRITGKNITFLISKLYNLRIKQKCDIIIIFSL